uniref:RGS domain-containing protein n=1 Tax=Arcella intermedia TaxID=1963864 RepID=A0A6B2LK49_9EUKA
MHTSLPDIDELFKDRDLFLAFREYLYQQLAHENLSFFVEAANFEALKDEEEVKKRATEIFDKFIGPQAEQPINLDFMVVERLKKNLAKPTNQSFKAVTDKIWKVLTNEWFPDFVVSPLYLACNDETIEYVKSDGGKKKSATMDQYQLLCLRMNAERKKGDGEKKGDSEKKED